MKEKRDALPYGWEWTTIGEVTECLDSKRVPVSKEERAKRFGDIPYYGANGLVGWIDDYLFDEPLVLVVEDETFIGREKPFSYKIQEKSWVNNHAHVLRATGAVDTDFLNYSLLYYPFTPLTTGTTGRRKLTQRALLSAPYILPPLNEQRRIVAKIEALKARSQRVKEELEAIPALLDQFRQSVLAAAFRGDLTADWREKNPNVEPASVLLERIRAEREKQYEEECYKAKKEGNKKPSKPQNLEPRIHTYEMNIPDSWFCTSFADIASTKKYSMSSGPFGSALGTKDYRDSGIPVIRGQNIQEGKFLLRNFVYISEDKASELVRSAAYPGDIVIVAVGSSGQAAIVPPELPYSILSQNCNKFTVDESFVLFGFVLMLLQDKIAKSQMKQRTTDTVRQFISLTNLKSTILPIPPLAEQQEIIHRIKALFTIADTIEQQYKQAEAGLDQLDRSILAKAFRGELVPQDPNDEPASVLLERICAEREKLDTKKKAKGKTEKKSRKAKPEPAEPEQLSLPGFE